MGPKHSDQRPPGPLRLPDLPVGTILPELKRLLVNNNTVVLEAPPGAGKTTLVPLVLLHDATWLNGQHIVVLEPRRLAAQWAARRMAVLCGRPLGDTVGYRIRMERKVGPKTRIEVVTEGILTQRLLRDPELAGVGLVIFDEFHERSLQADLGLALMREVQQALRPDLRILIMSATLDTAGLAAALDTAAVVRSEGRQYPVETHYLRETPDRFRPQAVADATRRALAAGPGDILVFLPGEGEIRRTAALLNDLPSDASVEIHMLFGALPRVEQDAAIAPSPSGRRKIVLSTSIAESSLTIEGISTVIDCGWMRVPRYSPQVAMTRLETLRITADRADQRRGRAGRLGPGSCYRLWSQAAHAQLPATVQPEIAVADLTPVVLATADWGAVTRDGLPWVTLPPAGAWEQAVSLLRQLDALDDEGRITPRGRELARLPMHPRLGHMLLEARQHGGSRAACHLAAAISLDLRLPREHPSTGDADALLDALLAPGSRRLRGADRARRLAAEWSRRLGHGCDDPVSAGRLLAWAYPDRIARAQPGAHGTFLLANGRRASLFPDDQLATAPWLVPARINDAPGGARIFLSGALTEEEVRMDHAGALTQHELVSWLPRENRIVARREERLGAIVMARRPLPTPSAERIGEAVITMIRARGLDVLPWTPAARQLQARIALLRRVLPDEEWPDLSDPTLTTSLESWLGPLVGAVRNARDLAAVDLQAALASQLDWRQRPELNQLAPTHWQAPSGSRVRLDYCSGDIPAVPVRIQEVFGLRSTPSIARGRQPLRLELLSPARRPVQITMDLPSFWRSGYAEARKDLRGRYPKHHWPEDPSTAKPTHRGLKPRS